MSSGPESNAPPGALTSTVTLTSGELPRSWDTAIGAIDLPPAAVQRRLGKDARPFTVVKTMRAVASLEGQ